MYKKILLAVDDSDAAELALAQAVTVAKAMRAEVKALFVVTQALGSTLTPAEAATAASGKRILEHVRSKMEANGLHYSTELLEEAGSAAGQIADTITSEANDWEADLIVMGTHGRRGIKRMVLGSVSEGVLTQSRIPVLVVRSDFGD